MPIEDGVALADKMAELNSPLAEALKEYEDARYKRTGKCQLLARLYGEFYHAEGVRRELRNDMLSGRSTEQSYDGLAWLYDGI